MDLFYIKLKETSPNKSLLFDIIKNIFNSLHFDIEKEANEIYLKMVN